MTGCHHRAGLPWPCCRRSSPNLYSLTRTAPSQMVNCVPGETSQALSSAMTIPQVVGACVRVYVYLGVNECY